MSKKMKEKHKSKKNMLQHLKKIMSDDMGCGIENILKDKMKVTVAADSKKGLKEGLEKAIDTVDDLPISEQIKKKRKESIA